MRARRGGCVSAAALGQRGGSSAEHEAAGVGGHLEAVARGVAGAEEHDAAAVAELVDGRIGGAAGSGRDGGMARGCRGGGAITGGFPAATCGRGGVPARAVRQGVEGADVGEAEVADGLVAFDARGDDLAGDEDELGADGEREFLAAAEEVFHAAADEGDGAAVALGEALEDAAHAPPGDAAAAVGGVDDDAAAVIVVDGQDGGDGAVGREVVAGDGGEGGRGAEGVGRRGRCAGGRGGGHAGGCGGRNRGRHACGRDGSGGRGCRVGRRGGRGDVGRECGDGHGACGALFDFFVVHGRPPFCVKLELTLCTIVSRFFSQCNGIRCRNGAAARGVAGGVSRRGSAAARWMFTARIGCAAGWFGAQPSARRDFSRRQRQRRRGGFLAAALAARRDCLSRRGIG